MTAPGTRTRLRIALAWTALGLAVAAGLWRLPDAFGDAYREVRGLRTATPLERRLAAARGADIDTRVLLEADRLIPLDATFAVVTGPAVRVSTPVTLDAVPPSVAFWLLPRRRVPDAGSADWVVSYGADVDALGVEVARVVEVADGIAIAQVER